MTEGLPHIRLTIDKLSTRGEDIRKMLIPIAGQSGGPAWKPSGVSSSEMIIGTHGGAPPISGHKEWYFPTILSDFRAQYYERWLKFVSQQQEIWYLERAYLNIYRKDRNTRDYREFMCLHCDPACRPEENLKQEDINLYNRLIKQTQYKELPHLHIIVSEPPFPHAHLALNVGQRQHVLSSIENLSESMKHAVQMIKDEVFDALSP